MRLSDLPSFTETPISFPMPDGQYLTNASVAVRSASIYAVVCGGDHFMDARGVFVPWPPGTPEDPNRFSRMSVHLVKLDDDLNVVLASEITTPADMIPAPEGDTYSGFRGWDSARLFTRDGFELYCAMCVMGTGAKPEAAFYFSPIQLNNDGPCGPCFTQPTRITPRLPEGRVSRFEKNWMPENRFGDLRFHYRLGTLADANGNLERVGTNGYEVAGLNGGSQVVRFGDYGLCAVHEFHPLPNTYRRRYANRFALLDWKTGALERLSPPFDILGFDPEIITGLAQHPDRSIMISYGRGSVEGPDRYQEKPFIAKLSYTDVMRLLQ